MFADRKLNTNLTRMVILWGWVLVNDSVFSDIKFVCYEFLGKYDKQYMI